MCVDTRYLGINTVNLRPDTLALLGQSRIAAAQLVACGLQLALEHLNLVVDVVELLAGYSTIPDQLTVALTFTLGIGNLLLDGRELLVQVELLAAGRRAVGRQLTLAGLQLAALRLELLFF